MARRRLLLLPIDCVPILLLSFVYGYFLYYSCVLQVYTFFIVGTGSVWRFGLGLYVFTLGLTASLKSGDGQSQLFENKSYIFAFFALHRAD